MEIEKVNNIIEAETWFRGHSSGNLICVKDGVEKEVDCYPNAVDFFNSD